MNRRDFTKLCASAAMAGVVFEPAARTQVKEAGKNADHPQDDAYVRREGMTWIMGTSRAERTVALRDGRLCPHFIQE